MFTTIAYEHCVNIYFTLIPYSVFYQKRLNSTWENFRLRFNFVVFHRQNISVRENFRQRVREREKANNKRYNIIIPMPWYICVMYTSLVPLCEEILYVSFAVS